MMELLATIMDIVFIVFAVYGIFVFHKWHKVAIETEEVLEQAKKEMEG